MANEYLHIPIQAELITRKKEIKRCSLNDSVVEMVHLVCTTHFGENKEDDSFGNELWEHDFIAIENAQAFKEKISQSVQKAIAQHERRLGNVQVRVDFEQALTTAYNRRVKQRIRINVKGILRKTNEPFSHTEVFFMGPLSYF